MITKRKKHGAQPSKKKQQTLENGSSVSFSLFETTLCDVTQITITLIPKL